MIEPLTAPMAGEPHSDPSEETPGNGTPQSAPQRPDPFAKGYGSGIAKGRREGAAQILETLGFSSVEEIRAAIETRQTEDSGKAAEGERRVRQLERDLAMRQTEIERLARLADEARLDRLRATALARGVGSGRQLDAFVSMYGSRVRWGSDRELEVVEGSGKDAAPTGQALADWVDAAIAESPFLRPPRGVGGSGSQVEPASGPKATPEKADLFSILGVKRG